MKIYTYVNLPDIWHSILFNYLVECFLVRCQLEASQHLFPHSLHEGCDRCAMCLHVRHLLHLLLALLLTLVLLE